VSKYLKNSRNFFFISIFIILLVQLIGLWTKPEIVEARAGKSLSAEIQNYDRLMQSFCDNITLDSILKDNYSTHNNKNWEKFVALTKGNPFSTIIYQNDKIRYWSKSNVVPDYEYLKIKEGNNFRKLDNGWYIIKQKTIGNSKIFLLFNIYKEYNYQNEYLVNRYNPSLGVRDYIEINSFVKNKGYIIQDASGKNLFSISINKEKYNANPATLIIIGWILIFIFCYLTINSFAKYLWHKGETLASVLFVFVVILLLRSASMYWNVPTSIYQLPLFSPEKYASNFLFPSLGDLIINLLLIHWLVYFLFDRIKDLNFRVYNIRKSYILTIAFIISSFAVLDTIDYLFEGLVSNSNISFELANILSLDMYSVLGFFTLSLMMYSFYLFNDMLIGIFE
jgi:hypothetical protein